MDAAVHVEEHASVKANVPTTAVLEALNAVVCPIARDKHAELPTPAEEYVKALVALQMSFAFKVFANRAIAVLYADAVKSAREVLVFPFAALAPRFADAVAAVVLDSAAKAIDA